MIKLVVVLVAVIIMFTSPLNAGDQLSQSRQQELYEYTVVPFIEKNIKMEMGESPCIIRSYKLVNYIYPDGGYPRFDVAVVFDVVVEERNNLRRTAKVYRSYSVWTVDYQVLTFFYTDLQVEVSSSCEIKL